MNKIIASLLAVSALSFAQASFAADPATVNGKGVKQAWVDYIAKQSGKPADANMKAAVLKELVATELVVQEAQRLGLDKSADYNMNTELANRKILADMFVMDFMKKNPVTDAELKSGYEEAKKQMGEKEFNAKHILVKTEPEAKEIIAQLGKGGDFAKLAKEKSQDPGSKEKGGDLGWFPSGQMVKPFSDALGTMKKGDVSSTPVQTQFGWHIIKLVDSRASQVPPLDKVKANLERAIQQRKLERMMQGLQEKAKIDAPSLKQ